MTNVSFLNRDFQNHNDILVIFLVLLQDLREFSETFSELYQSAFLLDAC